MRRRAARIAAGCSPSCNEGAIRYNAAAPQKSAGFRRYSSHRHVPMPVSTSVADTLPLQEAALSLLFSRLPPGQREQQSADAFAAVDRQEFSFDNLIVATDGEQVVGAVLAVLRPEGRRSCGRPWRAKGPMRKPFRRRFCKRWPPASTSKGCSSRNVCSTSTTPAAGRRSNAAAFLMLPTWSSCRAHCWRICPLHRQCT